MRHVALAVITYLVRQVPVDTSKALSNFRIALGGTSYGAEVLPPHVPGMAGSTRTASAAIALAAARETLKLVRAGTTIAIINTVPYLKRLNEGSSAQHPGGFIEAAVLVGKRAAKAYNFDLRKRPRNG